MNFKLLISLPLLFWLILLGNILIDISDDGENSFIINNNWNQEKSHINQYRLKLLAFNVWNEGTSVNDGMVKIRDVIATVNPDIIAFSEVRNFDGENWTMKIANELNLIGYRYNMAYAGKDLSILSKFPVTSARLIGSGFISRYDIDINGNNLIVCPVHLDHTYYAPYLPRGYNGGIPDWNMISDNDGNLLPITNVDTLLTYNLNSTRDESIGIFLDEMKNEKDPIILLGDFNEPSHLDWTDSTKDLFDHNGTVVSWPLSSSLYKAEYLDAYRVFFPDEVKNPGFSWPSYVHDVDSPSYAKLADERERIDFIYYKGNDIEVNHVALVGPKESYVNNVVSSTYTDNENFIVNNLEWPSDHKAIYAELNIRMPASTSNNAE